MTSDNQTPSSIGRAEKRTNRSCSVPGRSVDRADIVSLRTRLERRSFDAAMAEQSEEERLADGRLLVLKVIGKIKLRVERKEYDDLTAIINKIPGDVLILMINKLPSEQLYQDIPSSLCVVSAIFSKLHTDCKDRFPTTIIRSDDFLHHLVRYFSELLKYNDQTFASARSRDYIRNILTICWENNTQLNETLSRRVEQFSKVLDDFSQHSLVEIVSRSAAKYCMKLYEALKIEMERASAHFKIALHKFNDVLQNIPHQNIEVTPVCTGTNMVNELEEKTAEHMRLLTQKLIEDRLYFNQSILNAVDKGSKGQISVTVLICTLEARVKHDKEVLKIISQIKQEFGVSQCDEAVIPMLERFHRAYALVWQLLDESIQGVSNSDETDYHPKQLKYSTISIKTDDSLVDGVEGSVDGVEGAACGSDTDVFDTVTQLGDDTDLELISSTLSSSDSESGLSLENKPRSKSRKVSRVVRDELASLQKHLADKDMELQQANSKIKEMTEKGKEMNARLADQARRQLKKGAKFDEMSEFDCRPATLTLSYDNLYTQTRLDALDELDDMQAFDRLEDGGAIKSKLLFSVVVVSFRTVYRSLTERHHRIKRLLDIPDSGNRSKHAQGIQEDIYSYLRQSASHFNIKNIKREVSAQLWKTLYDFPELQQSRKLQEYIDECVSLAWKTSVQTPPMVIHYEAVTYCDNMHTRFLTSDVDSTTIRYHVWPALVESETGHVFFRGVVVT